MKYKKNLFFPLTIKEIEDMDMLEESQECDDGYGLFHNDWYDTMGGQNFLYFPNRSEHSDETY